MVEIGFTLSSEERGPTDLVRIARLADEAKFTFSLISDHFHPWTDRQGHSPFVWSVIGGVAEVCGPDPERHLDALRQCVDAGYHHVYVHQVGPDQEGAIRFYEDEVPPKIG